jgi:hypothetical protein
MGYETVHTVWDYYDGPRSGIADFEGRPHYYNSEWDDNRNNYAADIFTIMPVDEETFSIALEQWKIWQEWEFAFHGGEVSEKTHPGIPGNHPKYEELEGILKRRISDSISERKRVFAKFRAHQGQTHSPIGVMRDLEVEWTVAAPL